MIPRAENVADIKEVFDINRQERVCPPRSSVRLPGYPACGWCSETMVQDGVVDLGNQETRVLSLFS